MCQQLLSAVMRSITGDFWIACVKEFCIPSPAKTTFNFENPCRNDNAFPKFLQKQHSILKILAKTTMHCRFCQTHGIYSSHPPQRSPCPSLMPCAAVIPPTKHSPQVLLRAVAFFIVFPYSTVTLLARLRGLSTSRPRYTLT